MSGSARVALITGCGKLVGIGNSTARALAAKGVTVVVSDVRPAGERPLGRSRRGLAVGRRET